MEVLSFEPDSLKEKSKNCIDVASESLALGWKWFCSTILWAPSPSLDPFFAEYNQKQRTRRSRGNWNVSQHWAVVVRWCGRPRPRHWPGLSCRAQRGWELRNSGKLRQQRASTDLDKLPRFRRNKTDSVCERGRGLFGQAETNGSGKD